MIVFPIYNDNIGRQFIVNVSNLNEFREKIRGNRIKDYNIYIRPEDDNLIIIKVIEILKSYIK